MALTPDDIRQIINAVKGLPQWQWLESQMQAGLAEGNEQGGIDTVGDAMPSPSPAGQLTAANPPQAYSRAQTPRHAASGSAIYRSMSGTHPSPAKRPYC